MEVETGRFNACGIKNSLGYITLKVWIKFCVICVLQLNPEIYLFPYIRQIQHSYLMVFAIERKLLMHLENTKSLTVTLPLCLTWLPSHKAVQMSLNC